MSSLRKNLLSRGPKRAPQRAPETTPLKWSDYFDEEINISLQQGVFHGYKKGNEGPLLLLLHGGGYSALTWALLAKELYSLVKCQVLAIDLRGHGKSKIQNDMDLSLENLSNDVLNVIENLYKDDVPPIIVVGHSMGGAVAVEYALHNAVMGLVVIDVVEGSALESLSSMQNILRGRPTTFKSVQEAIRWCHKSGMTHNIEAARVSVPGQIKNAITGELAASEFDRGFFVPETIDNSEKPVPRRAENAIAEEDEGTSSGEVGLPPSGKVAAMPPPSTSGLSRNNNGEYKWRIDLSKTETFWSGWFQGLSQKFLDVQAPKILLLANIHGLDTTLTLGQMQGKFQMQVLSRSGHAIHEDQPQHVAEIIATFMVKQRFTTALQGFTPSMPAC